MKRFFLLSLFVLSSSSFAQILSEKDSQEIKALSLKASSLVMKEKGFIRKGLVEDELDSLKIEIELMNNEGKSKLTANILPQEENCGCQDVFQVELPVSRVQGGWTIDKSAIKVQKESRW